MTVISETHARDIAERMARAENDFIGCLQSFGELSRFEAAKVLQFMLARKMVKVSIDRISVKHGRYFDRDFLRELVERI